MMMKSIPVILCIAASMTIASAQSVFLYYPEQPEPTPQPVGPCFLLMNAAGQLPYHATGSVPLDCSFHLDTKCRDGKNRRPLPIGSEPMDISSLPESSSLSFQCKLSSD
ncbi:hypothetical protein BCR42DRAFT_427319 [Absidia repens]|uniref:Uncharacterized protein n=1 Tax=Absidia repens TaxID=90262 RepID=A0A1X2HZR8_9FUNG|nr:hypothetical protein BCR42DRAFT_427319 [Absidia repens]